MEFAVGDAAETVQDQPLQAASQALNVLARQLDLFVEPGRKPATLFLGHDALLSYRPVGRRPLRPPLFHDKMDAATCQASSRDQSLSPSPAPTRIASRAGETEAVAHSCKLP